MTDIIRKVIRRIWFCERCEHENDDRCDICDKCSYNRNYPDYGDCDDFGGWDEHGY